MTGLVHIGRGLSERAGLAAVWPWLAQLGTGRGGFYSYDWLENLFGLPVHQRRMMLGVKERAESAYHAAAVFAAPADRP